MGYFLTFGHSPWGQQILTHVSWNLLWASLFAGLAFLVAHASYMVLSAHRKRHPDETDAMEAARPEKWWITKAMIVGWITRRQYLEHHDPQRWSVAGTGRRGSETQSF
jgi:hypothetical protein